MAKDISKNKIPFAVNTIRLGVIDWLIVVSLGLLFVFLMPSLWLEIEGFEPGENYRQPYGLSNDYWLYAEYCDEVCEGDSVLVVGDSAVWGHFVKQDETLSSHLNGIAGGKKFVNMGVDGMHPAGLFGLMKYYGGDISGKDVILYFNPLWLSSAKSDLSTDKEYSFNHSGLVEQFGSRIKCYSASRQDRIETAIKRRIGFFGWTKHLQMLYFSGVDGGGENLASWVVEHPYGNPFSDIGGKIEVMIGESEGGISGVEGNAGASKYSMPWVELDGSVQWYYFKQTIRLLTDRGNKVFVVVGPFNEEMLSEKSFASYKQIQGEIAGWLGDNKVNYYIPEAMAKEYFADASHLIGSGYAILAENILKAYK